MIDATQGIGDKATDPFPSEGPSAMVAAAMPTRVEEAPH